VTSEILQVRRSGDFLYEGHVIGKFFR
jgi:hypothetical protein